MFALPPAFLSRAGGGLGDATAYRNAVIADAPTGYWRLAESAGTTAANEIGGGAAGTYTDTFTLGGATLLNGIASLQLAGTGYVSLASGYSYTNNFVIEALIRRTGSHAGACIMMRRFGAYMFAASDTSLILNKDQSAAVGSASITLNDDKVHHVAVRVDASNNWALYHNGSSVASGSTTAFGAGTTPFFIGADFSGAPTDRFFGGLGEVAIYNPAISAAAIAAHAVIAVPP